MPIDRMPMPDRLDHEQEAAAAAVRSGPRGELVGPFIPLLRCPELMTRVQHLGAYLRFESELPGHIRELVVLQAARHWDQAFEWGHHQPLALRAGLPATVIDAIGHGRRLIDVPGGVPPDVMIAWSLVDTLLTTHRVDDQTYIAAVEEFGERGVVEAVTTAGYYATLAMIMNTARTSAPADRPALPDR